MSLLLTGTRDHALLAMVVQEAHQAVKKHGGFVGRTALQKIMYFLKVTGVPMTYRFDLYHYGPFCDQILNDVDWLIADGVITDYSDNPQKYSKYAPATGTSEILRIHEQELEKLRENLQVVVRTLVPMRHERLELLATLDYLYRHQRASNPQGPWRESVIKRFQEVKPNRFPEGTIRQAYDDMVNAGLIKP